MHILISLLFFFIFLIVIWVHLYGIIILKLFLLRSLNQSKVKSVIYSSIVLLLGLVDMLLVIHLLIGQVVQNLLRTLRIFDRTCPRLWSYPRLSKAIKTKGGKVIVLMRVRGMILRGRPSTNEVMTNNLHLHSPRFQLVTNTIRIHNPLRNALQIRNSGPD